MRWNLGGEGRTEKVRTARQGDASGEGEAPERSMTTSEGRTERLNWLHPDVFLRYREAAEAPRPARARGEEKAVRSVREEGGGVGEEGGGARAGGRYLLVLTHAHEGGRIAGVSACAPAIARRRVSSIGSSVLFRSRPVPKRQLPFRGPCGPSASHK